MTGLAGGTPPRIRSVWPALPAAVVVAAVGLPAAPALPELVAACGDSDTAAGHNLVRRLR